MSTSTPASDAPATATGKETVHPAAIPPTPNTGDAAGTGGGPLLDSAINICWAATILLILPRQYYAAGVCFSLMLLMSVFRRHRAKRAAG